MKRKLTILICCLLLPIGRFVVAQTPSEQPLGGEAALQSTLAEVLRAALAESLTGPYEGSDDWGQTKKVVSGYKIKGKPLDWRLQKRTKEVKHGRWQKYSVALVDPQQNL